MYLVTKCTPEGNDRPSTFKTFNEAQEYMIECAAEIIQKTFGEKTDKAVYEDVSTLDKITDKRSEECRNVLSYAALNIDGVKVQKNKIKIDYPEGDYNIIQLFEVEVKA